MHVPATHILQHRGAHLAGEGARRSPRTHPARPPRSAVLEQPRRIAQVDIRREYHDVDRPVRLQRRSEFRQQSLVGGPRAVHFPIARDHRTTHSQPLGSTPPRERRRRLAATPRNCKPRQRNCLRRLNSQAALPSASSTAAAISRAPFLTSAGIVALHHDPNHRFGARSPQHDAAAAVEALLHRLHDRDDAAARSTDRTAAPRAR